MTHREPLLQLAEIDKQFGAHKVLRNACMELRQGEIHALLGENGAGKSTLMNILTGVYTPDGGQMQLRGEAFSPRAPSDSASAGIGMVHQHFRLVESFTLVDNLLLSLPDKSPVKTRRQARELLLKTAEKLGLSIDPDRYIETLSVAEKQRCEICKVLSLGAKILILDEPTAVLTDAESSLLLAAVRRMTEQGLSIILITHKLREVIGFSHRVTIMRKGETVLSSTETEQLDIATISTQMMGESKSETDRHNSAPAFNSTEDLLVINHLSADRSDGGKGIADITLRLRAGEILGMAGVGGNGQNELVAAIAGTLAQQTGSIMINGAEVSHLSVLKRRDLGLRIVPADRTSAAIFADASVSENLTVSGVLKGIYGKLWLNRRRMQQDAQHLIEQADIAGATTSLRTGLLSGGNAQKVVLAREIDADARLLIAHSPTRGLDVHACAAVHSAIRAAVARGMACLLISEDLEEVMALSHRIAVMSAGQITGELQGQTSADEIGRLMLGHD